MITNDAAALMVPERGFIRKFYDYVNLCNDVPHAYVSFCALATLAACTPSWVRMPEHEGRFPANLYILLTGPTGGRKSTSMDYATDLLARVDEGMLQTQLDSVQWLTKVLNESRDHRVMLSFSEFGAFLKDAAGSGYKSSQKPILTGMFDGVTLKGGTISRKDTNVKDPRLSIIAACNQAYLYAYTQTEDWMGGFIGRFIVVSAVYKTRKFRRTPVDPQLQLDLFKMLEKLHRGKIGKCMGTTPEAADRFDAYGDEVRKAATFSAQDSFAAARERLGAQVKKLAMAYALDRMLGDWFETGDESELVNPWYITDYDMYYAIVAGSFHWQEASKLAAEAPPTKDASEKWRVYASLDKFVQWQLDKAEQMNEALEASGVWVPRSYLASDKSGIGMLPRRLDEYLEWLSQARVIQADTLRYNGVQQLCYRFMPPQEELRVSGLADVLDEAARTTGRQLRGRE